MFLLHSPRGRTIAAALLFPLLALVYLHDVLFQDKSLSAFDLFYSAPGWQMFSAEPYRNSLLSDSPSVHHPERQVNWSALRQGHRLGLYPFLFSGAEYPLPGVGAALTALPLFFLDTPDSIDWSTWLRLSLAGVFMYALLVALRLPIGAALFGGVVWTFGLNRIAWLEFPQHLAGELWLPLVFAFFLLLLREGLSRSRLFGLFASLFLMSTSGYNQFTAYALILLGLSGAVYVLVPGGGVPAAQRLKRWLAAGLVIGGVMLLLLPNLLYEKSLIAEGLRGTQDFRWNLAPLKFNSRTLMALLRHGVPSSFDLERFVSPFTLGALWGYPVLNYKLNVVEYGAYFSISGLLFAAFSVLALAVREHRALLVTLLVTLFFLFALYHDDVIVRNLMNLLPFLKYGSYSRLIAVIAFIFAILAAFGVSALARQVDGRRVLALAAAAALVAWYIYAQRMDMSWVNLGKGARYYPVAVIALLVIATALLLRMKARRESAFFALAVLTATADLFVATAGFNTTMPNQLIFPRHPAVGHIVRDSSDFRVAEVAAGQGTRSTFRANILSYYGLPAVEGYLTTANSRYLRVIGSINPQVGQSINGIVTLHEVSIPLLRMLGVKYLIADHELADAALAADYADDSGIRVYRMRNPLARVYCADEVAVYETEEQVLENLPSRLAQHDRPVAVSREQAGSAAGEFRAGPCEVQDIFVATEGVRARVRSEAGSMLFIPYTHTDRWRATIDGRPAPLTRANYAFMALKVPAGDHAVEVRFANPLAVATAVLQALAGVAMLLVAVLATSWTAGWRALLFAVGVFVAGFSALVPLNAYRGMALPESYLKTATATAWSSPAATARP